MLHMFACGATVQVRVPPFTVCLPFSSLHCLVAMQPLQVVLDTTASDDELTNFLSRLSVALQRRLLRLLHYLEDQRGPAAAVSVDALIHNAPVYAVVDCECRLTITSTTLAKDATERGGNCRETARRAGLVETLLSFACLQLLFCFLRFCNRSLFFLSLVSGSKKQVQYHVAWLPWLGSLRACYGWVTWHRRFPRVPCFPSCPPCWACSMLRFDTGARSRVRPAFFSLPAESSGMLL